MAKRLASSATLIGRAVRLRDRSRLMRTALARFTSQGAASRTKRVQRVLSPCLTFLLRHNIASLLNYTTTTHRVDIIIACPIS
jgi:hypothetical protein